MDTSKLPKIRDEDRESEFGFVHGVSGPGLFNNVIYIVYSHKPLSCESLVPPASGRQVFMYSSLTGKQVQSFSCKF